MQEKEYFILLISPYYGLAIEFSYGKILSALSLANQKLPEKVRTNKHTVLALLEVRNFPDMTHKN